MSAGEYFTAVGLGFGLSVIIMACVLGICWAVIKLMNGRKEP